MINPAAINKTIVENRLAGGESERRGKNRAVEDLTPAFLAPEDAAYTDRTSEYTENLLHQVSTRQMRSSEVDETSPLLRNGSNGDERDILGTQGNGAADVEQQATERDAAVHAGMPEVKKRMKYIFPAVAVGVWSSY